MSDTTCDICRKQAVLFYNEELGLALCEGCDIKAEAGQLAVQRAAAESEHIWAVLIGDDVLYAKEKPEWALLDAGDDLHVTNLKFVPKNGPHRGKTMYVPLGKVDGITRQSR